MSLVLTEEQQILRQTAEEFVSGRVENIVNQSAICTKRVGQLRSGVAGDVDSCTVDDDDDVVGKVGEFAFVSVVGNAPRQIFRQHLFSISVNGEIFQCVTCGDEGRANSANDDEPGALLREADDVADN